MLGEGLEVEIVKIIMEILPREVGTPNRQIFEFARALKSLPQFANAELKEFGDLVEI
jgi:hypothetical protein